MSILKAWYRDLWYKGKGGGGGRKGLRKKKKKKRKKEGSGVGKRFRRLLTVLSIKQCKGTQGAQEGFSCLLLSSSPPPLPPGSEYMHRKYYKNSQVTVAIPAFSRRSMFLLPGNFKSLPQMTDIFFLKKEVLYGISCTILALAGSLWDRYVTQPIKKRGSY